MLYLYANVKIKYGRLPAFNEAMVTVKRVMEANGWKLVGGWMTLVGDLHEVHDVWEVEDANVVPAAFAAAALRVLGFLPLIFDLEADNDTDHVVALFKSRGHWGAVAKSNFAGCRYREPVYRTLRELALSYFNVYFNLRGERTLRRYSRPVNLARFDQLHWMTTEKSIWFIAEYLCDVPHLSLLKPGMKKYLTRIDARTMESEMVGHRKK